MVERYRESLIAVGEGQDPQKRFEDLAPRLYNFSMLNLAEHEIS